MYSSVINCVSVTSVLIQIFSWWWEFLSLRKSPVSEMVQSYNFASYDTSVWTAGCRCSSDEHESCRLWGRKHHSQRCSSSGVNWLLDSHSLLSTTTSPPLLINHCIANYSSTGFPFFRNVNSSLLTSALLRPPPLTLDYQLHLLPQNPLWTLFFLH